MRYHCMEMTARHTNALSPTLVRMSLVKIKVDVLSPERKTCIYSSYNRKCVLNKQFLVQCTEKYMCKTMNSEVLMAVKTSLTVF
jgi:hypothetical protein